MSKEKFEEEMEHECCGGCNHDVDYEEGNHSCECKSDCDNDACHEELDEYEQLEIKNKELEEKLLRQQAEIINYRRRKDEEMAKILKYANEDLILGILPILDNFERAINMDDDNLEDEVSKFLAGFKMIHQNLSFTLENFGVKEIDGNNKPFNPTYHDAMLTEKVADKEPSMVLEVLQKGYLLNDKVIRPAMVKVSE